MVDNVHVLIVMGVNISNGRGIPKFVYNFIKYSNGLKFTLIQSSWTDVQRWSIKDYEDIVEKVNIITIDDYVSKFNWMMNSTIGEYISFIFIKPVAMYLTKLKYYKLINKEIKKADFVYLTSNYFLPMISSNYKKIIGSSHTLYVRNGLLGKFLQAFTKNGLIWKFKMVHTIKAYFIYFPHAKKIIDVPMIGVDTNVFYPQQIEMINKIKLLFVAGLDKSKGLDIVLDAYAILDHTKFELHIVGKGSMEKDVKGKEKEGIFYYGAVSEKELGMIYGTSHIFVYPTSNDVFPSVVLEALSSGCYVLCSDMLKGIFDDFEGYALSYIERNPEKVKRGIIKASEKIDQHLKNREKIHEKVKEKYDWKLVAQSLSTEIKKMKSLENI